MKTFLCALAVAFVCSSVAQAQVSVRGHYSGSGRYVQPHHRSSPDASYNNNWSVSPNVNPYNGRAGTLSPTLNDRPPQRSSFDRPSMLTPSSSMMRGSLYGR